MSLPSIVCDAVYEDICEAISSAIHTQFVAREIRAVGGGCVNAAFILSSDTHSFFLKTHALNVENKNTEMFQAEADGLNELASMNVIKIPRVICWGATSTQLFLVLENLVLCGGVNTKTQNSAEQLGRQLAALHKPSQQNQFGWYRNNAIGATPQTNTYSSSWVAFYREHRLQYQLSLAESQGYGGELQKLGRRLCDNLDVYFMNYQPYPSLLHGDLWSGNYGYVKDNDGGEGNDQIVPVLFDPAVYYGDREADIAMTELFGGFSASFYDAYNEVLPLDKGYKTRKNLYNLYHILNHLNLFGRGYHSQAVSLMRELLKH